MSENEKYIYLALCELGDYFSRLGGSARYLNMSESEIPLYIACSLAEKCITGFDKKDYLNPRFLEAASPVLEKTDNYLDSVIASDDQIFQLIKDFVDYSNRRLKNEKSDSWLEFIKWFENRVVS